MAKLKVSPYRQKVSQMNKGLCRIPFDVFTSIWINSQEETLHMINKFVRPENVNDRIADKWPTLLRYASSFGMHKCVKLLLELGANEELDQSMFGCITGGLNYTDMPACISLLLAAGAKLPNLTKVKTLHLKRVRNAAVVLLNDVQIGFNRAQKAALTLLMIKRFHPKEGVLQFVNMDIVRLFARMVYASGAMEWQFWRNKSIKQRKRKKRKVLGKRR